MLAHDARDRDRDAPDDARDAAERAAELQSFVDALPPDREPVASEIAVLQSIYGDDAVRLWHAPRAPADAPGTIRYAVRLSLPPPHAAPLRVLVSLPPTYPAAPPQLQLLSRYIGPAAADASLFGAVLRTYISAAGVEWAPDAVCVFDGLEYVLERAAAWLTERVDAGAAAALAREDERDHTHAPGPAPALTPPRAPSPPPPQLPVGLPAGLVIAEAAPIVDRKSVFVGRACRIAAPAHVPLVIAHLLADRRIARAAHPVIHAWRVRVGAVVHQDNDDDGESAAGARLAHLLQILDVEDVLVVVTRHFGGIHLGPDRFKHINQAARDALELGGFLDAPDAKKGTGRGKKH